VRLIFGEWQLCAGAILRIQEWPVSVPTIFIPISEKKLSEADDIAVRVLVAVNRYLSCLLPIDLGLAYSVDKSKRLTTVHVGRRQTGELLEGGIPGGTLDGQFPIFQKTWLGKQHQDRVGNTAHVPPFPVRWRVGADITKTPRTICIRRHPRKKFCRKSANDLLRHL